MAYINHTYCHICGEITQHVNNNCVFCEDKRKKAELKAIEDEFERMWEKESKKEIIKKIFISLKNLEKDARRHSERY